MSICVGGSVLRVHITVSKQVLMNEHAFKYTFCGFLFVKEWQLNENLLVGGIVAQG